RCPGDPVADGQADRRAGSGRPGCRRPGSPAGPGPYRGDAVRADRTYRQNRRVTLTPADGDAVLAENFAPWVRDLELRVEETGPDHAVLRLPWSSRLAREGGGLSGQALMAAADTATV